MLDLSDRILLILFGLFLALWIKVDSGWFLGGAIACALAFVANVPTGYPDPDRHPEAGKDSDG